MVWYRRLESFLRQRSTTSCSATGTEARYSRDSFGSSFSIADKIGASDEPENGLKPVIISYSTAPKLKMSERASTLHPFTCSGEMYGAVP
jgi:hypothetical protein